MKEQIHREGHHTILTDSPEDIQRCMECTRPECVNCLSRPKSKVMRIPVGSKRVVVNKTDIAFLREYAVSATDREIANKIGLTESGIFSSRKKFNLPPTRSLSEEEKRVLADELLAKIGK